MPKKTKINQEDLDIFHQAMAAVNPLKNNKILLKPTRIQKKSSILPLSSNNPIPLDESPLHTSVQGEEFIVFKQTCISDKILRKLRKGQYNVEAKLDLHGMTAEKANNAVGCFLQECLQEQIRVALIIHGKGHHSQQMPMLKNKLNHWLRSLPFVLAFCSATPAHGSRGATYVLLKCIRGDLA